jgi:hypothetical protein
MFLAVPPQPGPPLIIVDGGLGALAACWAECVCRPSRLRRDQIGPRAVAYFPLRPDVPGRERRLRAARLQADLCGMSLVEGSLDLAAAEVAALSGITRVIWPVHAGNTGRHGVLPTPSDDAVDLDAAAGICDRAMLVGLLARLDGQPDGQDGRAGDSGMTIETPYADFSDLRLAAHAVDLDAPIWACWWCEHDAGAMCGHCSLCERTMTALRRVAGGLAARLTRGPVEPSRTPAISIAADRRAPAVARVDGG